MKPLITRRGVVRAAGSGLAATGLARNGVAKGAASTIKLRLLETSDLHMFVYDYDYYTAHQDNTVGLAKVATLIKAARGEVANSMLFDNGDIIQGNPLGDYMAMGGHLSAASGHPMFRAMNLLGYDAATFGNHEFNYGLDFLHQALASAAFPFVCANIETASGAPFARPTMVLRRTLLDEDGRKHALRIGVIGFVTPQIMIWDKPHLEGRIRTIDIVDAAHAHVPALRQNCDLVIALCHSGISASPRQGGDENAAVYLAAVEGIDVIFTGHAHRVFPGPDYAGLPHVDAVRGTLGGKPAVMPGFWGSHLGVIDLSLRKTAAGSWRIDDFAVGTRPIYRREGHDALALVSDTAAVLTAAAPEHRATISWMEQPVGSTTAPINSFFALVGNETSLSLINRAQLWYARPLLAATRFAGLPVLSAASPFKAGGTGPDSFVDIPAGPLDMKAVASLYMFANTVCAVRCSGSELREWLERSASIFNRIDPSVQTPQPLIASHVPSYMFDVISGLTYAIDPTQPERYGAGGVLRDPTAHRISALSFGGKPIDPDQQFVVVTNNYRANGGGDFPGTGADKIVLAAPDLTRDVLVRYVAQHRPVRPEVEPVWRYAKLPKSVLVTFDGNEDTASLLESHSEISRIGEDAGGYVKYGFKLG